MNFRKVMGKEWVGTTVGVLIFGTLMMDSWVLSGESVVTAVGHPVGTPLMFEVTDLGEDYGITIDRPPGGPGTGTMKGRRGKKNLKWRIEDPSGRIVLADRDAVGMQTRFVKFTPSTIGRHTLIVEWNNSGFFKRQGTSMITLLVNRDDKSILMRWLGWLW